MIISRLNQVRVADGFETLVELDIGCASPTANVKTDSRRTERMRSLEDPTVVKAVAASVVERLELDVAPQEVLVIHCSLAVSRCNGSPCHWTKTSLVERVGLPVCNDLLTLKPSRTGSFLQPIPPLFKTLRLQTWTAEPPPSSQISYRTQKSSSDPMDNHQ